MDSVDLGLCLRLLLVGGAIGFSRTVLLAPSLLLLLAILLLGLDFVAALTDTDALVG